MVLISDTSNEPFPLKQLALLFSLSALAISAGLMLFSLLSKDIQIYDNGKPLLIKTMGKNVRLALELADINLTSDDYVSVPLDSALDRDGLNVITIKRAVPVNLYVDGEIKKVRTFRDTVKEFLQTLVFRSDPWTGLWG